MAPNPRRTTRSAMTSPNSDVSVGPTLNTGTTLRKSPTFHSPTSPVTSTSSLSSFVPPSIRRSTTNLDDVVDSYHRRAAMILDEVDKSLAGLNISPKKSFRDRSLPLPPGLLDMPIVDPAMHKTQTERRVLRPRSHRTSNNRTSDSGLGTSIASTPAKGIAVSTNSKKSSVISRAAASTMENLPSLNARATARITEHVVKPLLSKPSLADFRPIVLDVPRRIRDRQIICLRDLEKTLIFMAPERTKTAESYLEFCLTSVRCIKATVEYLSDKEQVRPTDRPYTNLYFMDLEAQLREYASQLAAAKDKNAQGEMDLEISDEVRLHGGLTKNGRPAELIRVKKNGKAYSMATGEPVELDDETTDPIRMKRSLSEQLEEDEDILRSMARRKKNPTPEELAPKKCREPGCNKEFKRPCDLTKHEKTHSRPWKCPVKSCKYHEYGWPTEKEMDRHHNDKHSDAPAMYACKFPPCPYKSKRESNCKQHMEKAHNWTYVRTKTNRKKGTGAGSVTHATPTLTNISTPQSHLGLTTPPSDYDEQFMSLPDDSLNFPKYLPNDDFLSSINQPPTEMHELDTMDLDLGQSPIDLPGAETPSTVSMDQFSRFQDGTGFTLEDDIYTHPVHIPSPNPALFDKLMVQPPPFFSNYVPVPQPHQQLGSIPSPHISPIGQDAMLFTPKSQCPIDEGFDSYSPCDEGFNQDFDLFPGNTKMGSYEPLFNNEMPSTGLGYSQHSQDIFNPGNMDWTSQDFGHYAE